MKKTFIFFVDGWIIINKFLLKQKKKYPKSPNGYIDVILLNTKKILQKKKIIEELKQTVLKIGFLPNFKTKIFQKNFC